MAKEIKRIDIAEFRRLGFLQEANRVFFHPLGLALEVIVEDDGSERLGGVWDSRGDPEGIAFSDPPDAEKADAVAEEHKRHENARRLLLGDVIQEIGQPIA